MVYAPLAARRRLLSQIGFHLLPPRCTVCGAPGGARLSPEGMPLDLCMGCLRQLPLNHHACPRCALPLVKDDLICGRCLRRPPRYERATCALRYQYPAPHLIRALKYAQRLPAARVLGELLADHLMQRTGLEQAPPDCILPVPLHSARYRSRGYNQVIEIGLHLQRRLHIPLRTDVLERVRATPEQAGLSRRERRRNVRGAFRMRIDAPPEYVAILDDVMTTGSTVNEIAKTLAQAGTARIEVWGVARAAPRNL